MTNKSASWWHPGTLVARVRGFFAVAIWEPRLKELPKGKALLYRTARIIYSAIKGFFEDELTFRAAALTYYSALSVVPFLAFAFAVLKGFGAYDTFVSEVVEPYVRENFAGNPSLERAIDQVFTFVADTNVSGLGISGLLFLTYTSVSLLATVESVLNELWCFGKGRGLFRRVTDYVTLVVTTPMLVLVAVTFGAAAQSSSLVLFLRHQLALGPVIDVMLRSTSVVGACLAMTALFLIMPNGHVRPLSALIGGIVSGVLWQGALILHVDLQVGVARYNALYSGFGALPMFLVWVYVSWLAVLLGAEVAAGHQNEQTLRQRIRAREVDQALEEALGIAVMARATRAIIDDTRRPSVASLAADLGAPPQVITKIVEALSGGGFLVAVKSKREDTIMSAKDIDAVRVRDVLAALRHRTHRADRTPQIERQVNPAVTWVLEGLDEAAREAAPSALTLRELAERVRAIPSSSADPPA